MRREIEIPLMEFCVSQYSAFRAECWYALDLPRDVVGTMALMLRQARGYGHSDELDTIGRDLNPAAHADIVGEMRRLEMYPARIYNTMRVYMDFIDRSGPSPA